MDELPDSLVWSVVEQILLLDRASPDFAEKLRGRVKRLVHHQKHGVYSKLDWWIDVCEKCKFSPEQTIAYLKENLSLKIETHKEWAKKSDTDIWTS